MSAMDRTTHNLGNPGGRAHGQQPEKNCFCSCLFRRPRALDARRARARTEKVPSTPPTAVSALAGAGLVHRLGDFVIPTRAARRSDELYEGAL